MKFLKKSGKITAGLVGAAVISCMLGACSGSTKTVTKDDLFSEAMENASKSGTINTEGNIDIDAEIGASGISVSLEAKGDLSIQALKQDNATHIAMNLDYNVLGQNDTVKFESYAVEEDGKIASYSYTEQGGKPGEWTVSRTDSSSASEIIENAADDEKLKENIKELTKNVTLNSATETVDGRECYVASGPIELDADSQTLSQLSSLGIDKVSIDSIWYFDKKSHELYMVNFDMKDTLKKLVGASEQAEFNAKSCHIELKPSYDELKKIEVPQEIKDSAKESAYSPGVLDQINAI